MSHYYDLCCLDCKGTDPPTINHAWEILANAVQDTPLLAQLRHTGRWDDPEGYVRGLANYLITHAECSGFVIEGEYSDEPLIFKRQPDGTYERR